MDLEAVENQDLKNETVAVSAEEGNLIAENTQPMCFKTRFEDYMLMYADKKTAAEYFAAHQGWFCRCAHPMKAEYLGDNGYVLTIGRFGSFGYYVEPKIGLVLQPPENDLYITTTVPVPDYTPPGYDVDYHAQMLLKEIPAEESPTTKVITRVEWILDLSVYIKFPQFILKLSRSLLQSTGDRVLDQIVRQVSKRLTAKVLKDFHTTYNITLPDAKKLKLK
jgi:Protein of unknown function (DUF1997)